MKPVPDRVGLPGVFSTIFTITGATFFFASPDVSGPGAVMFGIGILLAVPFIVGYALSEATLARDRPLRSKTKRRIAELLGFEIEPCGCVHTGDYRSHAPDVDVVESEKMYVRSMKGSRLRFRLHEERLCRCHRCGKHFHGRTAVSRGFGEPADNIAIECWPEEEPDVVEEIEEPIVEER